MGRRGYPQLCRELSRRVRAKFPKAQIVLSTWTYDMPPCGEWTGLTKALAADKSWLDYIQADAHEDFPRYPLDKGVPGGLPLLNFPEISMWGQCPWGGYGANPLCGRLQRLWDQTARKLAGGFPYSEGIFEDLNEVICSQFYWDPARGATETVKEYLAFEYSPDVAAALAAVVQTLEKNHLRGHIGPAATAAFEAVRQADAKLTPQAKRAWRWRIFYLRALIDSELLARHGRMEGATLKAAFDELTRIYHAEHTHSMPVRPPQIPSAARASSPLHAEAAKTVRLVRWFRPPPLLRVPRQGRRPGDEGPRLLGQRRRRHEGPHDHGPEDFQAEKLRSGTRTATAE